MFSLAEYLMKIVIPLSLRPHNSMNQSCDVSTLTERELRKREKKKECDRIYRARLRKQDEEYLKKAGAK